MNANGHHEDRVDAKSGQKDADYGDTEMDE